MGHKWQCLNFMTFLVGAPGSLPNYPHDKDITARPGPGQRLGEKTQKQELKFNKSLLQSQEALECNLRLDFVSCFANRNIL